MTSPEARQPAIVASDTITELTGGHPAIGEEALDPGEERFAHRHARHLTGNIPALQVDISRQTGAVRSGYFPPMDGDALRARIQTFLDGSGSTPTDLSRAAGLNEKAVADILTGKSRNPRGDTQMKILRAMDIVEDESLPLTVEVGRLEPNARFDPTIAPLQPQRVTGIGTVPVMGTAAAGDEGFFEINLTDGPVEFIDLPPGLAGVKQGDLFAIRVHGESMEPVWEAGDPVFIVKSRPLKRGAFAVALLETGKGQPPGAYLKQYVRQDDDVVTLAQFNPPRQLAVERRRVRSMWRACHWRELVER